MPILDTVATVAPAVIAGANMYSQGRMNRKNRKFSEHMYERSMEDNQRIWEQQNEYNNPTNQMKRLKEAGLNPALVYGTGAVANASSEARGGTFSGPSTDAPTFDTDAPGKGIANHQAVITSSLQKSILQQNLENAKATRALINSQTLEHLATTNSVNQGTESGSLDLAVKHAMSEQGILEAEGRQRFDKNNLEIASMAQNNQEQKNFQMLSQEEQRKRISLLEAQIKNAGQENIINSVNEALARQGINPKAAGFATEYWQQLRRAFNAIVGKKSK